MWEYILFVVLIAVLIILLTQLVVGRIDGGNVVSVASAVTQLWSANIERETIDNSAWRRVLTTSDNLQAVAMSVPPGEELGWEVHKDNDQFFRIESGKGTLQVAPARVAPARYAPARYASADPTLLTTIDLSDGTATIVPKGSWHNVINTGSESLKLYTVYGPPHHPPDTLDLTHADEILREQK